MPAIDIDRDTAHEAARVELAKPIYPRPSMSQRLHDLVNELLERLQRTSEAVPGGWLGVLALLTVLVIAVALVIWLLRRTIRTRRGADAPLFDAGQLSAAAHRATAEQFAARGDWAAAIRHRLRALARELEENGVLEPVAGRTAGELADDAGDTFPHLRDQLGDAATAFNDVTYGTEPGTESEYRQIAKLDERLRARRPAGAVLAQPVAVERPWVRVR